MTINQRGDQLFRLWIASYFGWNPSQWYESPPQATALEVVEDAVYSADEAALFLEGFNSCMLNDPRALWAVAVPVTLRYEGDAQPGTSVQGFRFT